MPAASGAGASGGGCAGMERERMRERDLFLGREMGSCDN